MKNKIKTFSLLEFNRFVKDGARKNKQCDYGEPAYDNPTGCIVCQFFKSKGIVFDGVTFGGDSVVNSENVVLAKVELPEEIREVHNVEGAFPENETFKGVLKHMQKRGWTY
jgi:hypothetical protein